jgi:uncharacterized protein YjbI with pentapeptide repeats
MHYQSDQEYTKQDFTKKGFQIGEYESCTFIDCNFSNIDLSACNFTDCDFKGCNMGMVKLSNTVMNNVLFVECKLLGLHFEDCNKVLLAISFKKCHLNLSCFYQLKMKKTKFIECQLQEVDFTETDLTESLFEQCDFQSTIFDNTILEKADLSGSYNFSINPNQNRIKQAKFSRTELAGLLDSFHINIV